MVVEHLTKRFGERVAVDDVSFMVGYGEVLGFLGPNGAGEMTTVRTLGTLIAPSSGPAIVAGIPLSPNNGSTRSTDVRVAQRLSVLGSFPPLIIVALTSLNVISESTALAVGLAAALLAFDLLAWRVAARMFDRERLVTGRRG